MQQTFQVFLIPRAFIDFAGNGGDAAREHIEPQHVRVAVSFQLLGVIPYGRITHKMTAVAFQLLSRNQAELEVGPQKGMLPEATEALLIGLIPHAVKEDDAPSAEAVNKRIHGFLPTGNTGIIGKISMQKGGKSRGIIQIIKTEIVRTGAGQNDVLRCFFLAAALGTVEVDDAFNASIASSWITGEVPVADDFTDKGIIGKLHCSLVQS